MKNINAFFAPADFISWYKRSGIELPLSDLVLTMLVNYMDGHDYVLASDAGDQLYQVDKADGCTAKSSFELVSIVTVLETVIGWNDSLIEHAEELLTMPTTKTEEESLTRYLSSLRKDEELLLIAWDSIPVQEMWKGERSA